MLRLLMVKRLDGWSDEEVERFVADSLVLRRFYQVYLEPVPDARAAALRPSSSRRETLDASTSAWSRWHAPSKVTRGRKLRVDSTVVETTIHHPTDSRLLGDGVRVLAGCCGAPRPCVGETGSVGQDAFRTRIRSVRGELARRSIGWHAAKGKRRPRR